MRSPKHPHDSITHASCMAFAPWGSLRLAVNGCLWQSGLHLHLFSTSDCLTLLLHTLCSPKKSWTSVSFEHWAQTVAGFSDSTKDNIVPPQASEDYQRLHCKYAELTRIRAFFGQMTAVRQHMSCYQHILGVQVCEANVYCALISHRHSTHVTAQEIQAGS